MIDRLHDTLLDLERLLPEAHEEAAPYIEALMETLRHAAVTCAHTKSVPNGEASSTQWQDPFGAWNDLPSTMLDELDQIRHGSQPKSPLEL